jgi:hypothetical protein
MELFLDLGKMVLKVMKFWNNDSLIYRQKFWIFCI